MRNLQTKSEKELKKSERKVESFALISAAVCVVLGIIYIAWEEASHEFIMISLAVLFILFGAVHTVGYLLHMRYRESNRFDFSFGLFNVIIGVLIIAFSEDLFSHFSIVVGLILMFKAVTWLQTSLELKMEDGRRFHKETIYCLILAVLGIVFMTFSFEEVRHGIIYHGFS